LARKRSPFWSQRVAEAADKEAPAHVTKAVVMLIIGLLRRLGDNGRLGPLTSAATEVLILAFKQEYNTSDVLNFGEIEEAIETYYS
jgi:hypothetical protein